MQKSHVGSRTVQNELLSSFSSEVYEKIAPFLEPVEFKLGATVCEAGDALNHVYFPEGCVLSLLAVLENGSEIECANIGREGAFGLFTAMYSRASYNRCSIQLEGQMRRCRIAPLRMAFGQDVHMQELLVSYSETVMSQVTQTVACNSLHTVEERMSRWLLMMHDRAEGRLLTYTHAFLGQIMGVNRTSATLAAQSLQNKGLIKYRRGSIQVKDRIGLEEVACECYAEVQIRFDAFRARPSTNVHRKKPVQTVRYG